MDSAYFSGRSGGYVIFFPEKFFLSLNKLIG